MTPFEHRSIIPATLDQVWAFHAQPNAFRILTPPPIFVQVHRDDRTSLTHGEVEFTLWFLFLPARWLVNHEPGSTPHSFVDRTLRGVIDSWVHEHTFREVPGGVELIDHIEITHKTGGFWSLFSRIFFDGLPLRMLFVYRHLRTRIGAPKMSLTPQPPLPKAGEGEKSNLTPDPNNPKSNLTPDPSPKGEGRKDSLTPDPSPKKERGESNKADPNNPKSNLTPDPSPKGEGR